MKAVTDVTEDASPPGFTDTFESIVVILTRSVMTRIGLTFVNIYKSECTQVRVIRKTDQNYRVSVIR